MTEIEVKSNTQVQVFESSEFGKARTVVDADGEPWFVVADVARGWRWQAQRTSFAGLRRTKRVSEKWRPPGGEQDMAVITEAGLYTVLVRSNKEIAKPFRRWVTHEVLPSIRKHGA